MGVDEAEARRFARMADDVVAPLVGVAVEGLHEEQHGGHLTFQTLVVAVEAVHAARGVDEQAQVFGLDLDGAGRRRTVGAPAEDVALAGQPVDDFGVVQVAERLVLEPLALLGLGLQRVQNDA